MFRSIAVAIATLVFLALPASASNFRVVHIDADTWEAVLADRDSGEQWTAAVGDAVGEWIVTEIGSDGVSLGKRQVAGPILSIDLPYPF